DRSGCIGEQPCGPTTAAGPVGSGSGRVGARRAIAATGRRACASKRATRADLDQKKRGPGTPQARTSRSPWGGACQQAAGFRRRRDREPVGQIEKQVLVLQHIAPETPGAAGRALEARNLSLRYVRPFEGEQVPRELGDAAALVVMGGPMGVYE